MKTNEFKTPDNKYTVISYGNGWAYEVLDKAGDGFFVQDDEASQLQAETEDFTNTIPIDQRFECFYN
jgi:hypothetical protein